MIFTPDVIVDSGSITVDNFPATQPVSIATMPSTPVTGTFWQATQPVSGSVSVGNFPATQAVTGTFWQATQPVSGTVTTTPVVSSSATIAQITSTGSNQTILAANSNRKKAILNFQTGLWSVKFGATASTTSLTYKITSNNTVIEIDTWVGIIDAICTTAGKIVDVTELV
jgi:hypothetical protein